MWRHLGTALEVSISASSLTLALHSWLATTSYSDVRSSAKVAQYLCALRASFILSTTVQKGDNQSQVSQH